MNPSHDSATRARSEATTRPAARVLVCDDDRLVLVTLVSALRRAGYEVIEADNGDDAILLARQHRPDIALLDIRMDGKSGLDVASYLRDYVGTPFMFLSAFSDEAFIEKAREFGALDYLVKPIDFDLIAPAVEAALRAREGQSSLAPGALAVPTTAPASDVTAPAATTRLRRAPVPPVPLQAEEVSLIAIGLLMERFRLTRSEAQRRLSALAASAGRDEAGLAEELVRSIDTLNAAGTA